MIILQVISSLLLVYLFWGAFYQFVFSVSGVFYKPKSIQNAKRQRRIAVFIPAYKEDGVIVETAKVALEQNYPAHLYDVIVVADSLKGTTLAELSALPIRVQTVQFEQSTKAKAINATLAAMTDSAQFDIAVVLDADNVMQNDFLARVNNHFEAGCMALQGRRAAKNSQTDFALLDAASEDINNHILCRGHRTLGLSARLAGSGMAFDFALFESVMSQVNAIGGFDKEMELRLTEKGITIEYDEQAIIFDEKVSHSNQFSRQRSRWIAAQYRYAKRYILRGGALWLSAGNFDFFNKTLQMTLPPRLTIPVILMMGTIIQGLLSNPVTIFWFLGFSLSALSFIFGMPAYCFQVKNLKMWMGIPRAFGATLMALSRLREANRVFIHTSHHI